MKEKTFEELIEETPCVKNGLDDFFGKQTVLKLMQQVREATIAECREAIRKEHKTYIPFEGRYYQLPLAEQLYNLNKIPTDRIKTEK